MFESCSLHENALITIFVSSLKSDMFESRHLQISRKLTKNDTVREPVSVVDISTFSVLIHTFLKNIEHAVQSYPTSLDYSLTNAVSNCSSMQK